MKRASEDALFMYNVHTNKSSTIKCNVIFNRDKRIMLLYCVQFIFH